MPYLKLAKIRGHNYTKLTRALLRHLRTNGGIIDKRAQSLRMRRAQVLAKLVQLTTDSSSPNSVVKQVIAIVIGSIGINDQIDAMLAH